MGLGGEPRDYARPGLNEAIRAVGGVTELARRIGISQPSVSNWSHIPAERVLTVEAVTGVARVDPAARSLCREQSNQRRRRGRSRARAGIRAAGGAADARAGRGSCSRGCRRCAAMRRRSASPMSGSPRRPAAPTRTRSSASSSICSSGSAAASCCPTAPIISPASCTSARWRGCARISRASASSAPRASTNRRITPRSCARSCPALPAADSRRRPAPTAQLFEKHLAPWIGRFFADLERAEAADFYRRVGTLGRVFMEIETEAFALPSDARKNDTTSSRRTGDDNRT